MTNASENVPRTTASKGEIRISDLTLKSQKRTGLFSGGSSTNDDPKLKYVIGIVTVDDAFFVTSLEKIDEFGEVKLKMEEEKGKRKVFKNVSPSFRLEINIFWYVSRV